MTQQMLTRPYSGAGDSSLPDNVKALPDRAREIWVAAFNSAWDSWDEDKTDQPREGYAFAVAWAAVKKLYKQEDGKWVKRSLVEGEGYFTKVWRSADGAHRWRATVMDDGVDQYATRMTIEFQDDVCSRAAANGLPWLGIAHFGKRSQIGETTRLYRDGRMVKAEGVFLTESTDELQASLARAAYEAATREADLLPAHRSIAVSQAFYPEAHTIEDLGVVAFTAGRIEHIAMTTRKANSRCDFGVEEEDNMRRSKTRRELRREDAAAILGDDLARQLSEADPEDRAVEHDGLLYRMYGVGADGTGIEVSADGENWEDAHVEHRAMVPTHRPPLNERGAAWDAGGARKRIWAWATDGDDFDAPKARQGFAVYDSDNPDNKTGMALPHHDVAEGKLMTHQRGVMAAGAVCMGARGGMKEFQEGDTKRAQTHLAVHYGQMDRTPPWKREASNLRHWAEAMEEVELLAEWGEAEASDVENARGFLRHRLGDGTITKSTVANAMTAFKDVPGLGAALLRATAESDFAAAIKAVVSDPDAVGQAPPPEHTGPTPEHRTLQPDSDYRSELQERYGAEPDDSVMGVIAEKELTDLAYTAAYTFVDIVVANIVADADELTQEQRLQNVQAALNEFGQIIASIIAQAAERSKDGVKPEGEGDKPVKPDGGPESDDQAAVGEALEAIRTAVGQKAEAGELQRLLEDLSYRLSRCVEAAPPSVEDAVAPILERLQAIEDRLEDRSQRSNDDTGDRTAGLGAPPRRKGFRPRLDPPTIRSRDADRPGPQGYSPEQFARGAHRQRVFNPYA